MMKKRLSLCLVCLLLLCACQASYTVTRNGLTYQVDPSALTVTQGENVYQYSRLLTEDIPILKKERVTITYPDGSIFYATRLINTSEPSGILDFTVDVRHTMDYDPDRYIPGEELVAVIYSKAPSPVGDIFSFVLLAIVVIVVVKLNFLWYGHIRLWRKAYKEQDKD